MRGTRGSISNTVVAAAMVTLMTAALTATPAPGATPRPEQLAGPVAGELDPAAIPVWLHAFGKTITYEVLSSADALVLGTWWTGSAAGGSAFAAVNATVASFLYYLHELIWNWLGPDPNTTEELELSLWKMISYRIVSAIRSFALTYLLTGDGLVSIGYVGVSALYDAAVYLINEIGWHKLGPPVEHLGSPPWVATAPE